MNIYVSPSVQDWNKGVGDYGTEEQRMNELATHVIALLKYNGFTVFRNKPEMTLEQVVMDSNKRVSKNGIHLALHSNAGGGEGAEIYYFSGSETGKRLAESIYKHVAPLTPSSDRGVKHNKVFRELNGTLSTAVLLEAMFHDNAKDVQWILRHMEALAEAIVKGLCEHVRVPYKPITIVQKPPQKVGTMYRVVTGSFSDRENAENRVKELKAKGFESFIDIK